MTSTTERFGVACINEEAIFWINAPQATKNFLISKGASVPTITADDQFVAQQRAAAAAQAALPKTTP